MKSILDFTSPILSYDEIYQVVEKSSLFDREWYLYVNKDVEEAKIDPIEHWIKFGIKEGRKPSKMFDSCKYIQDNNLAGNENPIVHYEKKFINKTNFLKKSVLFDKEWYINKYSDVRKSGIDPYFHYLKYGWKEGRNPSESINGGNYLRSYQYLLKLDINPVEFYSNFNHKTLLNKGNILFVLHGGMGDLLIAANYLMCFYNNFLQGNDGIKADIFVPTEKFFMYRFVFGNLLGKFGFSVYGESDSEVVSKNDYDFTIDLNRIPYLKFIKYERLFLFNNDLRQYLYNIGNFWEKHSKFIKLLPQYDGQINKYGSFSGKKRFNFADFSGELGMTDEFFCKPLITVSSQQVLEKFGLCGKRYIIFHRGCDAGHSSFSTKLWPSKYYEILIKLMRSQYKDFVFVQLGVTPERCPKFLGIDVYLAGKTSLQEMCLLLANASLHIDGEGGMVHLRHIISGKTSVVLFGPTSLSFYGYKENLNIRTNYCKESCEWMNCRWQDECTAGYSANNCMLSLTPDMVFEHITSNWNVEND